VQPRKLPINAANAILISHGLNWFAKKLRMFCFVGLIFVKCGYFIASDVVTFSLIQSILNACSLLDADSDCNSVFV
jgi:hypothetical protein